MTYGELKTKVRALVWPTGEAPNLVPAHEQSMLDALVDLQTWVDCLKQDNTNLVPHCATLYKCGMTVFDAPRGEIKAVGVVDKANTITSGTVTASKVGNLVTANSAFFTAEMVGAKIQFPNGDEFTILTFIDETHLWVADDTVVTAESPGIASYFYLSSRLRINPEGRLERLGENDNRWHQEEIVGPAGGVQLGIDQTPSP